MKTQSDLEFQRILKNIRSDFSFLFQRNYQIVSAMFTDPLNEDWDVVLAGDNYLIKIYRKEGNIHLLLSTMQLLNKLGFVDLYDLVYLMNGAPIQFPSDETEQLRKTAWLLETHFDTAQTLLQRIHLGISFAKAGELFKNSSPSLLHYKLNNPVRRGRKTPRVASA